MPLGGDPAVSVVVPTHDRRRLLERKLRTLDAHRTAHRFEVVVVADGCSDDTETFLDAYRPGFALRWAATPGLHAAAARNHGAGLARAALLLFSDDDVIPRPGWLDAHQGAHGEPRVVATARLVLPPHLTEGAVHLGRAHWWNLSSASMSIARDQFERAGGYDPAFSGYGGEDPELGYRLRGLGARFVALRDAVAEHWDEGYATDLERKAFAAGRAHARVWRKHGDARIALALGIHPAVAVAKRLVLNDLVAPLLRGSRFRYERAYLDGARAELGRPAPGAAP